MATEIVTFKVKDGFTPAVGEMIIDRMRIPPGLRSLGWGHTLEEHNTIIAILSTFLIVIKT